MTEASRFLFALAERIAAAYVAQTGPRAILLTGSAAEGVSDYYSDVDMMAYYDELPADDRLSAARAALGAGDLRVRSGQGAGKWWIGEHFLQDGVECQVAHFTIPPRGGALGDGRGEVHARHGGPEGHHGRPGRRRAPRG